MPLINLKTNLKSLKFGNDRPGGGSSNQPYIKSKIPSQDSDSSSILSTGGSDSLLRGGILAPIRAAEDASRLTQMFSDIKTPTGLLFTAKQNLLSRLSVHNQSSTGIAYGFGKVNQGIYLPTSTIGQSLTGFTGTHLNTFGIDPSSPMSGVIQGGLSDIEGFPSLGLNRYEDVVKTPFNKVFNRLEVLHLAIKNDKKDIDVGFGAINTTDGSLIKYTGGPGSISGVGKTRIKYADQRTGNNNIRALDEPDYFYLGDNSSLGLNPTDDFIPPLSATDYGMFDESLSKTNVTLNYLSTGDGITWENTEIDKVYPTKGSLYSNPLGATAWSQFQIGQVKSENLYRSTGKITDFRGKLAPSNGKSFPPNKKVLGKLNNGYSENIQMSKRVHSGNPGKSKDVSKYGTKYGVGTALDKITASPIYTATTPSYSNTNEKNDLCKFSIGIINNDKSGTSNFMHFRALIDGFSDDYSADWGETQYVGRADKFYNYKGFNRTINLSFTVVAQSKAELIPMYKKLNHLASSLAPSYSQGGFMQGNLVRLTVGGYLYNQVGILKAITYTIPQSSPWEIGLDDEAKSDNNVKELPHMIKVSGFQFTPIHDFVPRVSNPSGQYDTRYISLANGVGIDKTNYKRAKIKPNLGGNSKSSTATSPAFSNYPTTYGIANVKSFLNNGSFTQEEDKSFIEKYALDPISNVVDGTIDLAVNTKDAVVDSTVAAANYVGKKASAAQQAFINSEANKYLYKKRKKVTKAIGGLIDSINPF